MRKKIILFIILLTVIISGCGSSKPSFEIEAKTLMPGHNVAINKQCFGAISKEAYDKLVSYTSTQNVSAAEQMRLQGKFLVLNQGDIAEIEEVTTGSVKIKITSGLYKGISVYTFREMVDKTTNTVVDTEPIKLEPKKYVETLNKENLTKQHKQAYREWQNKFNIQVQKYDKLDKELLNLVNAFKRKEIKTTTKAKSIESQLEDISNTCIGLSLDENFPKEFKEAVGELQYEFIFGINDRRFVMNKIIAHFENNLPYNEAIQEIDLGIQSSDEFFQNYKNKKQILNLDQ